MSRKVEGLDNLNNILTLPIGSKFGLRLHGSPCGIRGHSPSGPKRYRDFLHQHERTQQRQTLKGNLMLTLIFLFLVMIGLLVFLTIWDTVTNSKLLAGGILGFFLAKLLNKRKEDK